MAKGLSGFGLEATSLDNHVGLTPDQAKRVRYHAIVVAAPTTSVTARLVGIMYGAPEADDERPSSGDYTHSCWRSTRSQRYSCRQRAQAHEAYPPRLGRAQARLKIAGLAGSSSPATALDKAKFRPHAIGRGSSALTVRPVSGGGSERSSSACASLVVRIPRAYRTMEDRPTARRTRVARAAKAWCVVVVWTNSLRTPSPRRWPKSAASTPRQVDGCDFDNVVIAVFKPRSERSAHILPHGGSVDRPRRTRHARRRLCVFVFWANSQHAPHHAVGRGSTATTARLVSGRDFKRSSSARSTPVAHVPRTHRTMEYRPTARGARAPRRLCAWLWCGRPTRGALVSTLDRGSTAPTG